MHYSPAKLHVIADSLATLHVIAPSRRRLARAIVFDGLYRLNVSSMGLYKVFDGLSCTARTIAVRETACPTFLYTTNSINTYYYNFKF